MRRVLLVVLLLALLLSVSSSALALDKQGAGHDDEEFDDSGFNVSGALFLGALPYNPTYAARPNNTGLAVIRAGAHLDVDLIGQRLFVPIDLNTFTDRLANPARPSELDYIVGLATALRLPRGELELGVRAEQDRSVDVAGPTQTYGDLRVHYQLSAASLFPALGDALRQGDLTLSATLGLFFVNPTYAARPDNTGLALFRYAPHLEVSLLKDLLSLGVDATLFTDRTSRPLLPTELDFTVELVTRIRAFSLHLAFERDQPVDRPGLVQQMGSVVVAWAFDLKLDAPRVDRGKKLTPP